jgi:hypothetical protein
MFMAVRSPTLTLFFSRPANAGESPAAIAIPASISAA